LKWGSGMLNQGAENIDGVKDYNPFYELAATKFNGETLRLFLFYIGAVQYDNRIKRYTQAEISEITTIAQSNISKFNKLLLQAGIIYKDGRDYYLNDKYVMKGLRQYREKSKS
jgi:hypothetical protein